MSEEIIMNVNETVEEEKIYRNISGIYIFDTVNGERKALCVEECSKETRNEFLKTLSNESLISLANQLCGVINALSTEFNIVRKY